MPSGLDATLTVERVEAVMEFPQTIAYVRRDLFAVNGDGIARRANGCAASSEEDIVQAVVRASSGYQVNEAIIAFDKLGIPHVQLSRSKRRGHAPIGKANAQIADCITLGVGHIKVRCAICCGLRITTTIAKQFPYCIIVNRRQNCRIIRLGFTSQPAHNYQT